MRANVADFREGMPRWRVAAGFGECVRQFLFMGDKVAALDAAQLNDAVANGDLRTGGRLRRGARWVGWAAGLNRRLSGFLPGAGLHGGQGGLISPS